MKRILLLILSSSLFLTGCTTRAWYQGFVQGQVYQCNKLSGNERTNCLDSIEYNYDRYQRERAEYLKTRK